MCREVRRELDKGVITSMLHTCLNITGHAVFDSSCPICAPDHTLKASTLHITPHHPRFQSAVMPGYTDAKGMVYNLQAEYGAGGIVLLCERTKEAWSVESHVLAKAR